MEPIQVELEGCFIQVRFNSVLSARLDCGESGVGQRVCCISRSLCEPVLYICPFKHRSMPKTFGIWRERERILPCKISAGGGWKGVELHCRPNDWDTWWFPNPCSVPSYQVAEPTTQRCECRGTGLPAPSSDGWDLSLLRGIRNFKSCFILHISELVFIVLFFIHSLKWLGLARA